MSNLALQLARRFDPRHLAIVLIAVVASFAALELIYDRVLDSLVAFHLEDSDPAVRNSFPAVVTGLMLLVAGALSFAIASMPTIRARTVWRAAAIVLVLVGIEESLGLHTWADRHLGVDANLTYVPLVAIAAGVWLATTGLIKGHRVPRLMIGAGIAGWVVAAGVDAARTDRTEALAGGELLQMASAGLLLLGLFTFARSMALADAAPQSPQDTILAISRAAVSRVNLRSLLIGLAFFAVVFGILGAIVYPGGGDLRAFDLNKEQTFPATFSGVLLLATGALALLNGLVRSQTPAGRRWWIVLALVFAFLGIDEIAALHEAVQDRVHVWGQAVLAPVVVVGVYAWWVVLRRLWDEPPAGGLFLLGAAAWAVSQGIDAAFNEHWGWTIVPEELLEMAGSALFGLALLVALRRLLDTEPTSVAEPAPAEASPRHVPAGVH
jgi:hypothetical protein